MSSALDWISGGDDPQHLEVFVRLRAQRITDPYNPDDHGIPDWSLPANELPLEGAWTSGSSTFGTEPVRQQLTTTKTVTIFDPDADVREGDRLRAPDGTVLTVTGRPESDQNPWTGWRPTLVVAVEERTG